MMIAAAMQESRWDNRRQIGGPARGFWQFERGGVQGILDHPSTRPLIRKVLDKLDYDYRVETSYIAIEHNDPLAFCYARLNLWWLPEALPRAFEAQKGWDQYIVAWNPGHPRRDTFDAFFNEAWKIVIDSIPK